MKEKLRKYQQALEDIIKLNQVCADCGHHTACGVCSVAEGKPYASYHIANKALSEKS